MKINAKKTKTMVTLRTEITNQYYCRQYSKIAVSNFLFLDQTDARHEEDIKQRLVITKITFSKMNRVLTSRKISLNICIIVWIITATTEGSLHRILEWMMALLID